MPATNSGERIGNFDIREKIGEGGMALIYKALQPSLKRTVVLKKLKDPNREIIRRFKNEALLSASFNQENLTAIYDFLYINKSYYLVMEYIDGKDLRLIIDAMAPLPPSVAGLIILGIARGLEYTHARNILHRDIKPSNILVSYEGEVKLIDFGVAKDEVSTRLTLTGMIVGTPAYMAPEQASGDALNIQSDLFPLGILLYEMMTGVKPFYGENNTEILAKISQNKYVPPERINPEIPKLMRKIIKKALRSDREKRYQNAGELIHDLERLLPWQIRSRKKEVLSRFMNRFDHITLTTTSEQLRIKQLMGLKTWPWRLVKVFMLSGFLFMTGFMYNRFTKNQIGYAQLTLPTRSEYSVQIDEDSPEVHNSSKFRVGPLLKGPHKLTIRDIQRGGISVAMLNIKPGEFVQLNPKIEPNQNLAKINISTEPADAVIKLDQLQINTAAFDSLLFKPGLHDIVVSRENYETVTDRIELEAGQSYTFTYRLNKK